MVYFSKNVTTATRNELTRQLGYKHTTDLGKYLGVPILHSRVTRNTYSYMVERLKAKINQWNASNISLAGRVTLADSVMLSLPTYAMQTSKIPKQTCKEIEKLTRQFVWNGTDDTRHIPLVRWKIVQNAKSDGGLGLRRLDLVNKALFMKLCCNLMTSNNSLWVRILREKYKLHDMQTNNITAPKSSSVTWRFICENWSVARNNTLWTLGNGKTARFWTDNGCQALIPAF